MVTTTDPAEDLSGHELPPAPSPDGPSTPPVRSPWWRDAPSLAVLATVLLVGLPFTHAAGGRDPYVLTWALLLLLPAAAVVRPWRAWRALDLLALSPAAFALLACFTAPTGFEGNRDLAAF